ncbi:MAG: hypothetical protein IKL89_05900 [Clostridia bacterium]|nr:hypothetical protein [Clostridia bacterium]
MLFRSAAAVAVMLPDAFFTDMAFSGRLVTLFIILALGFLLGASGLSVAPLALALLMRGLDPGAVFLLLCAAPVFNMTELFNLGRVLGRAKSIIFMFASCVPSFVAAKIMQDLYTGKLWSFTFDELSAKPMENGFFLPGIVIFGLLCLGALVFLLRRDRKEKPLDLPADAVRLYLSGSWSEETESRLCDALAEVEGVSVAGVYAARGLVLIRGPVDFAALSAACESVGLTLERTEQ